MHHREDKDIFAPNSVNDSVREAIGAATSDVLGQWGPSVREIEDSVNRFPNFLGELLTEPRSSAFVGIDRFVQFCLRIFQKVERHGFFPGGKVFRTSSPGIAFSFP